MTSAPDPKPQSSSFLSSGSSGKVVAGCKNMLYQPNKDGVGEVCLWGRHVFMGYLEQEDATMEAIDEEGWLHSGDLGRMDNQGFLFITGRIKGTGAGFPGAPASRPALNTEGSAFPPFMGMGAHTDVQGHPSPHTVQPSAILVPSIWPSAGGSQKRSLLWASNLCSLPCHLWITVTKESS